MALMLLVLSLLLAIFVLDEPWSWVVVVVGGTLEFAESWFYVRWSQRRRPHVGVEALVGRQAVVSSDCRPEGQVRVAGELWRARCEAGASAGETVVVTAVDGLTLEVEPLPGDR
jgi:membrane protein implicated in regulation of membrane protease activity